MSKTTQGHLFGSVRNEHRAGWISSALAAVVIAGGAWSAAGLAADQYTRAAAGDMSARFKDADTDRDGRLSKKEYEGLQRAHGAGSDGTQEHPGQGLPATEHQAEVMKNFSQKDSDGNGYIDANEMETNAR